MTSDEDVIEALMAGLQMQKLEDSVEQSVQSDIDQSFIRINGNFERADISDNSGVNAICVNFDLETQREAFTRLDELRDEINDVEENERSIRSKFSWFKNNLPLAASVLTVTDFATQIGLELG